MAEPDQPSNEHQTAGSLWTTPASAAATLPLAAVLIDTAVTAEEIRAAVDATKERAAAFSGRVSDDVLRMSLG